MSMPRKRRKGRRLAFTAIAVLLIWAVLELGGCAAWWLATGRVFTWQRAAQAREQARAGSNAAADANTATALPASEPLAAHPYLGYVYDPTHSKLDVSPFGFVGGKSPLREQRTDRYVVAVTGGSVAMLLTHQASDHLIEALQRSPSLAGRKVEIVSLALGGYKQPQQLLAVQLMFALGAHFDCVIDLDGFNEALLLKKNQELGMPAWFPRSWAHLIDSSPTPEQKLRLGHVAVLREQRRDLVEGADAYWWSPLGQFVWLCRDRATERRLQELRGEAERAATTRSFAAIGPGAGSKDANQEIDEQVALWERCSRALHAICRERGALYCHFLQPNQYFPGSKPIGAEEASRAVANDSDLVPLIPVFYQRLQRAGAAMRADGVRFFDLTQIYNDHPEPLYVDTCCHVGLAGNRILAEHVAGAVRSQLDLAGVVVRGLRATPSDLRLVSPLSSRFVVSAIDDRGQEHDLTGAGLGVRMTSSPADFVRVTADGSVRPTRRGEGSLRVEYGDHSLDVPVHADWPDLHSCDDGRAGPGLTPPTLSLDIRSDADVAVQVAAIPDGPCRLLVWSLEPLPEKPTGVEASQIGTLLLPGGGATVNTTMPVRPVVGRPLFVRLYVLAADAIEVLAASNTVVLTPR